MTPTFVREPVFMDAKKRSPAWGKGLDLGMHIRLVGQLVTLAGIAAEARGDDVLPSGPSTLVSRRDMIEVELGFRQNFGAILAGELIPQENIAAAEFHFKPG